MFCVPPVLLSSFLRILCTRYILFKLSKFPVSCMFLQSEYRLYLVLYSLLNPPLELCLNSALTHLHPCILFLHYLTQVSEDLRSQVLHPVTLAHNPLTNPTKNYAYVRSCSGSRVPEDPTRGLIPHPAPVPFGTSLASSNFRFHCSTFQVFSVPSSIVTPVSCPLHILCSTCTTSKLVQD